MSVAEMQACLARLYVDASFRRLFYLDATVLDEYHLTPEERDALLGIDREMLDFFAASLKYKRRKRIERAFPLLFVLDRGEIDRYYSRYYQLYTAKPNQSGNQDALEFGAFMEESLAHAERLPPYASDLARYERLYYGATYASRSIADAGAPDHEGAGAQQVVSMTSRPRVRSGVQMASFRYDVAAIEKALQEGAKPEELQVEPAGYSIVFRPAARGSEAKMMRLNTPTKVVLDLCDGRRTISQIVAETESALGANGLESGILATIERLLSEHVLELHAGAAQADSAPHRGFGAAQTESM